MARIVDSMFVLAVRDLDASAAFFRDALGFAVDAIAAPGWRFMSRDGCRLRLGHCPDAKPAAEIGDHSYFAYLMTDDAQQLYELASAHRADIRAPLEDKPWGIREFCVASPEGHRIVVGERFR